MISPLNRLLIAALSLLTAASCQTLFAPKPKGKSPLKPARMSADSCVLDVFFVNIPLGDGEANDEMWREIDEQCLPSDLRQRLSCNGFRVGLVNGQMPAALSRLMELDDKPAPLQDAEGAEPAGANGSPRVSRRHIQTQPGQRSEIIASAVYEQLPVLAWSESGVGGETYEQAQGILAIKAYPQPDGQVKLDITPELHHGLPRKNFVLDPSGGIGHLEFHRPIHAFADLTSNMMLHPGAMVVMCRLPDHPGSLGHHFFTERDDKQSQKMLVIRLSQTQHNDIFDPGVPLELPER